MHMSNRLLYSVACITLFCFYFSENLNFDESILGEFAKLFDSLKIKYIALLYACILMHISSFNKKKVEVFSPEKRYFLFFILIIGVTTLYFQFKNGFKLYSIGEFLYIITPFVFVYYYVKSVPTFVEELINISFYFSVFFFGYFILYQFYKGAGISDINPLESFSPFESGLAPYFVFFEIYYLAKKDKKKVFFCALLSILSLKRLCLLKSILLLFFLFANNQRRVPKAIFYASIGLFIMAPLLIEFLFSDKAVQIIEDITGMDISLLSMSRNSLVALVLDETECHNFGLGTTVDMIKNDAGDLSIAGSLHSDLLRIYIEGTILSTIVFTISYFRMVKDYLIFPFLVVLHYFSEGLFNHYMLGAGNTCQLILFYLILYYLNRQRNLKYQINKV